MHPYPASVTAATSGASSAAHIAASTSSDSPQAGSIQPTASALVAFANTASSAAARERPRSDGLGKRVRFTVAVQCPAFAGLTPGFSRTDWHEPARVTYDHAIILC